MKRDNRYLQNYRRKFYSQFGEDGILSFILSRIPSKNYWCVEFGAWDGIFLSNTYHIIKNHNYNAVLLEYDPQKFKSLEKNMHSYEDRVHCVNLYVDFKGKNSLENILKEYQVPIDFDLLSIDIDGNDYFYWKSLHKYYPKVVIIEINYKFKVGLRRVHKFGSPFLWGISGTSITSMTELGKKLGYELVACVGCNLIFVKQKYLSIFQLRKNNPEAITTYEGQSFRKLYPKQNLIKILELIRRNTIPKLLKEKTKLNY